MPFVITGDGAEIFCKDWGSGRPVNVPPRLAADLGRLGRPATVPRPAGLPRRRPRPPRARALRPGRPRSRHGPLRGEGRQSGPVVARVVEMSPGHHRAHCRPGCQGCPHRSGPAAWPPTAPSSTVRARTSPRASSRTGGARGWPAARRRITRGSERSRRRTSPTTSGCADRLTQRHEVDGRRGEFVIYEHWETRAHLAAPRLRELVPQMLELIDGSIEHGIRLLRSFRPAR